VSTSIPLPGLRAESPAAALALYGIAQVLAPDVSVRWASSGDSEWCAEVISSRCADLDALVETLTDAIQSDPLTDVRSIASDVNKLTPQTWRASVEGMGAVSQLLVGLCAEAPLRPGGQVPYTPLCVISFRGTGSFFGPTAKQDGGLTAKDLRTLLHGPWVSKKGCNTLGLDPGARRQDGASMGPDPSADGVRGVPALVPLACRGLASVAPMPGTRQIRGGAFVRNRTGLDFCWPVFTFPVPAAAIPLLVARDWIKRTAVQRAAAGVDAVFASRILRDERRLSIGRRVA
jgi:hypothetical protein